MSNKSSQQHSEWRGVIIPTLEMNKLMGGVGHGQHELGMITQLSMEREEI